MNFLDARMCAQYVWCLLYIPVCMARVRIATAAAPLISKPKTFSRRARIKATKNTAQNVKRGACVSEGFSDIFWHSALFYNSTLAKQE